MSNEATDCAFTHETGDTMTTEEYEEVPAVEQEGLMECPECGEMLSLEVILLHLACKRFGARF